MSDLHGVPWLNKGVGEVQIVGRVLGGLIRASCLVAREQTPAPGSDVGQHGSLAPGSQIKPLEDTSSQPSTPSQTSIAGSLHTHTHTRQWRRT